MENRTLFSQMSPDEKTTYIAELSAYVSSSLPLLTSPATTAEEVQSQRNAILTGFSLSTAFPFCREFVRERLMFSDFSPSVALRLSQYFQEIIKQTSLHVNTPAATVPTASAVGSTPSPQPNMAEPTLQSTSPTPNTQHPTPPIPTRHRGRPTKTEAAAYTAAVAAKAAHDEAIHPSIFPQPVDDASTTQHPSPTTFDFAMREYRWLLSEALQHDIDGLRDYRTAFSDASQKAKFLAEQYATVSSGSAASLTDSQKAEIAQYAQEAHNINAIIEGIYQSADRELAEACLRLKYDPHYAQQMQKRGVNTEELRQALVPKLKVVIASNPTFKQSVLDKIHDEDPALAAQRKALATAKSEVDAIRKYMLRTDKPATAKRIATMEKRLARLRELDKDHPELKIEPDSYLAVINATKQKQSTNT